MHYTEDAVPAWKGCVICGSTRNDRNGNTKHEATCPDFMRGPDPGGDPWEWPTLMDATTFDTERQRWGS